MAGDANQETDRASHSAPHGALRIEFKIRRAAGAEGDRLRQEQAQVIREVLEWLARKRSESGRNNAA